MVVGTRPEAIKLSPVATALTKLGLRPTLVFTGQHQALDPADFGLDGFPAVELGCPGCEDAHAHAGRVSRALAQVLAAAPAELVVVQGDTSSALGGALAARLSGVAVAHVEAGLRSHDRRHPWPEEEFREAIDRECALLFAPTELGAANLRREKLRGAIHVTGNSGIDSLAGMELSAGSGAGLQRLLVTCHRRENWGAGLDRVAAALRTIAASRLAAVELVLHPNPALAARARSLVEDQSGITVRTPMTHPEMVREMTSAGLLLSDSGGIQEEAAALGIPLLVLRERTERPEAVASGAVELVGTDPTRIVAAVRRRLSASTPARSAVFGDGRAGERIAGIIADWLGDRRSAPLSLPKVQIRQAGRA